MKTNAREAARRALDAHAALRATEASEPPSDPETDLPVDPAAWMTWRTEVSKPAYDAWVAAMDDLDLALGEKVGRHPFTFRPICERLVGSE